MELISDRTALDKIITLGKKRKKKKKSLHLGPSHLKPEVYPSNAMDLLLLGAMGSLSCLAHRTQVGIHRADLYHSVAGALG